MKHTHLIKVIQIAVCDHYGVKPEDLLEQYGNSKDHEPGRLAALAGMSLSMEFRAKPAEIATAYNRERSTVLHAKSRATKRAQTDETFAADMAFLRTSILTTLEEGAPQFRYTAPMHEGILSRLARLEADLRDTRAMVGRVADGKSVVCAVLGTELNKEEGLYVRIAGRIYSFEGLDSIFRDKDDDRGNREGIFVGRLAEQCHRQLVASHVDMFTDWRKQTSLKIRTKRLCILWEFLGGHFLPPHKWPVKDRSKPEPKRLGSPAWRVLEIRGATPR